MAPDFADLGLRLVGAFYAFAGIVASRAARTSHLLDMAISAITLEKTPRVEMLRTAWLVGSSLVILAGGVALLLRVDLAAWLFGASALGQALYLAALAPYYFDAADAPDAAGRRGTTNAFVLYLAATALVLWAHSRGKLVDWRAVMPEAAIGAALVAVFAIFTVWQLRRPLGKSRDGASTQTDNDDAD